jgi:hypothetical protein
LPVAADIGAAIGSGQRPGRGAVLRPGPGTMSLGEGKKWLSQAT